MPKSKKMKQHLVIPGRSSKMSLNQNNSRKLFISVESLFKTCNWQNALFVSGSHRSDTSRAWSDCQHPSALWMSRSANAAERRRLPERRIDANICGGSWAELCWLFSCCKPEEQLLIFLSEQPRHEHKERIPVWINTSG